MSGQNTPISTAQSPLSLHTSRVSVVVAINSGLPGLETFLVDYFSGAKLFAKIQKTTGMTLVTVQGHLNQFPSSLEYLKVLLQIKFNAAIVWGEASAVSEENRYNSITTEENLPNLKRDPSSGEFLEKELEEISFEIFMEMLVSMANAATGFDIAKGWVPNVNKEHITIKRGDEQYDLEISTISSLPALLDAVQSKFPSAPQVTKLYRLDEKTVVVVTDVKDLREGYLYYVLAGFEELPKKQISQFSLEEFFSKLKTEQDMSDAQVAVAKAKFEEQGVKFKQLMATGDLALTDKKLKEIVIAQLGLRIAILAVIKSNS